MGTPVSKAKPVRWLAFGCTHVPLHDRWACERLVSRIAEYKPHVVVCLGDLYEADSASRWPSEYDWTLEHEFAEADAVLLSIREAAPNATLVFLPGNHDDNMLSIARIPRKVRSRCDWRVRQYDAAGRWLNPELLTYWRRPARYLYCRRRGVWRIGQVTFAHGYEHGINGDEAHTLLLGVPNGLYVGAHTHRPAPVTQAMRTRSIPLPYWHCNVGCLRDLKPPYVQRQRTHGWGHGWAVGEALPVKSWRASREWSASVEVLQTYDEWTKRSSSHGSRKVRAAGQGSV